MIRIIFSFVILLISSVCLAAPADSLQSKKNRTLEVSMSVGDHLTHEAIDSTLTGQLLNAADSSFVDTLSIMLRTFDHKKYSDVSATLKAPGAYLIRIDADGYESKYVQVNIPKFYKRELSRELKPVYLRKAQKKWEAELDELVVTATKLKFYMDGDTLVYNADAFSLAEGSMLDALIKKLPGVEINSAGEIFVNGKKVEALLLNGNDFFDSDRELMLENMPAYMVKNIQSYERVPISEKGTNREKSAKKELVMNVKLKRDYNTGWVLTAEGGGGSSLHRDKDGKLQDKFMGRLFALRFSDKSRLTAYANVNNLNDSRTPGEEGDWSPLEQSTGLQTTAKAGASYVTGSWDSQRYQGSVDATYSENEKDITSTNETFLNGGNMFGRWFENSRNYNFSVNTNHYYRMQAREHDWYKYISTMVYPKFSYQKWNKHSNFVSASFNEDVSLHLGKEWMDSIAAPNAGETLRKFAVNRKLVNTKGNGHSTNANVSGYFYIELPHNDLFDFTLHYEWNFDDRKDYDYEHIMLDYPNSSLTKEFQNRYIPSFSRENMIYVDPEFHFYFDRERRHWLELSDVYTYTNNESNRSLYMLNKLQEWNEGTHHSIGTLPSMDEMLSTMDADNSSRSTMATNKHKLYLTYDYVLRTDSTYTSFFLRLISPVTHERLNYWRGSQVDTLFSRNTTFLNPSIQYFKEKEKRGFEMYFYYLLTTTAPSMISLLNITDTSNPLNITRSNPNLRNTHTHEFAGSYRDKFKRSILFNASADVTITENAIASGLVYNKETGVRTTTPDNVNGNWQTNVRSSIDLPLDSLEKWRLKESASYTYNHSVDLSGTDPELGAQRSVVGSTYLNNELKLTYRPSSKMEFSAKGNLHYQHSTSKRTDFETINVCDFDYGLAGQMELPWNLQISTDLTMYSRRGYTDESMNTNEFVWNARLSKRLMKGKLTVMLDAFDLLGNLTNMRKTINAQGRSETFYNVIPSYALLHISYKLNKNPKNKK